MANRVEMAPMADTSETEASLIVNGVANENLGVDDGLIGGREKPAENESEIDSGLHPRRLPETSETEKEDHPSNNYPVYSKPVRPPLDVNKYATKKTVAQGMMDLALLMANANQLRYVLESGSSGPYFIFSVTLISLSIILQMAVGIILIFVGRYNVNKEENAKKANTLNNWVLLGVFAITVINVFFSAFGIDLSDQTQQQYPNPYPHKKEL